MEQEKDDGRSRLLLTRALQEDDPSGERPALAPAHAVAQIVQTLLLLPHCAAQPWNGHFDLAILDDRHLDLGPDLGVHPSLPGIHVSSPAQPLALRSRAQLHLRRKVGAGIDGIGFAVGIGDLGDVDAFQVDFDSDFVVVLVIFDEDEFTLAGLDLGKERGMLSVGRGGGVGMCGVGVSGQRAAGRGGRRDRI